MAKPFLHTNNSLDNVLRLVHDDYTETDLLRNAKTQL